MKKVEELKIKDLVADPNQPRKTFNEDELSGLASSIEEYGVIQPITVLPKNEEGKYQIVVGERRFRASKLAGKKMIPAIVKDLDLTKLKHFQIIENLQRKDVPLMEETEAISFLLEDSSAEDVAKRIGRSIPYVYQRRKLANLIPEFKKSLEEREINMKTGLAVSSLSAEDQTSLYNEITERWSLDNQIVMRYIERITYDLNEAPFDIEDVNLLEDAPACTLCPLNSLNAELFGEGGAICSGRVCYNRKKNKHLESKIIELKKTGLKIIHHIYQWGEDGEEFLSSVEVFKAQGLEIEKGYWYDFLEFPDKPTLEDAKKNFWYIKEEDKFQEKFSKMISE